MICCGSGYGYGVELIKMRLIGTNLQIKNQIMKIKKLEYLYICFFSLVIIYLFLFRLFRGVDLTDESFYATLAYRLAEGNLLLKDMWEQCSTSSVFPAILLKCFMWITGESECIILFFRLSFFFFNLMASVYLYKIQKAFIKRRYAILLSLFYVVYAPFCLYTFSYNSLTDLLFLLVVYSILQAVENQNFKIVILSGLLAAILAFTYPPMLFICCILSILLFLKRKVFNYGYLYFILGGLSMALIISIVLIIKLGGVDGIIDGIEGILSDPAYTLENIPIIIKLKESIVHLFTPIIDGGILIELYFIWLLILGLIVHKKPLFRLSLALYPIILLCSFIPVYRNSTALCIGDFILYLSFISPFLIFYTTKNKEIFKKFFYFEYLPSIFFYFVISVFSYGGSIQAVQGLFIAAFVTLKEIIFIVEETFEEVCVCKIDYVQKIKRWIILMFMSITIIGELMGYYSKVYRDDCIVNLTERVSKGPYKGIYTTKKKKLYIEEMEDIMKKLQQKDEKVLVLYHSNFVYLMLNMQPTTPTAWGIYPHLDNQNMFFKYFSYDKTHIPDVIFIVDVPKIFDSDSQREEYYDFCGELKEYINSHYIFTEKEIICKTGTVKKYIRISNKKM